MESRLLLLVVFYFKIVLSSVQSERDVYANFTTDWNNFGFNGKAIRLSSNYVSAMVRAQEICPQQKLCGGLIEYYASDTSIFEMYMNALERQQNITHMENNPCCTSCSCDLDCFSRGNCCPDALGFNDSSTYFLDDTSVFTTCFLPYYYLTAEGNRLLSENKIPQIMYDVISGCPNGNLWNTHKYQQMFDEIVFRQDEHSGKLYKNKYEAECNDATTTTRWRLTALNCPENLYTTLIDDQALQEYIIKECIVLSEPFEGMDTRKWYCPSDQGNNQSEICNSTQKWTDFDPAVRFLCTERSFYPLVIGSTIYPNTFCYMCNAPSNAPERFSCKSDRISYKSKISKEVGPVYDLRLDPTEPLVVRNDEEFARDLTCSDNEIYDSDLEGCIQIYCPYTSKARNHTCYNLIFNARKKVYAFSLLLTFSKTLDRMVLFEYIMADVENFTVTILRALDSTKRCTLLGISLNTLGVSDLNLTYDNYLMFVKVKAKKDECDDNVLASFRKSLVYSLDYVFLRKTFRIHIGLFTDHNQARGGVRHHRLTTTEFPLTNRVLVSAPILNCPHVVLNSQQVCELYGLYLTGPCPSDLAKNTFPRFLPVFTNINDTVYFICVDDYLSNKSDINNLVPSGSDIYINNQVSSGSDIYDINVVYFIIFVLVQMHECFTYCGI